MILFSLYRFFLLLRAVFGRIPPDVRATFSYPTIISKSDLNGLDKLILSNQSQMYHLNMGTPGLLFPRQEDGLYHLEIFSRGDLNIPRTARHSLHLTTERFNHLGIVGWLVLIARPGFVGL